jgi:hypothetical protein
MKKRKRKPTNRQSSASRTKTRAQKPPRFPSTACAVALRLPRGLRRRAMLERSLSLLATGRNAFV